MRSTQMASNGLARVFVAAPHKVAAGFAIYLNRMRGGHWRAWSVTRYVPDKAGPPLLLPGG